MTENWGVDIPRSPVHIPWRHSTSVCPRHIWVGTAVNKLERCLLPILGVVCLKNNIQNMSKFLAIPEKIKNCAASS